MIKMIITGAVVSKGANDGPAVKFSEKGDFARFRIGYKVYDTRAENNHRWINMTVKAFGDLCERITKMDLKAGSYISLSGRYDEVSGKMIRPKQRRACRLSYWMKLNSVSAAAARKLMAIRKQPLNLSILPKTTLHLPQDSTHPRVTVLLPPVLYRRVMAHLPQATKCPVILWVSRAMVTVAPISDR